MDLTQFSIKPNHFDQDTRINVNRSAIPAGYPCIQLAKGSFADSDYTLLTVHLDPEQARDVASYLLAEASRAEAELAAEAQ